MPCVPALADGPFWGFPKGVPCVPVPVGLVVAPDYCFGNPFLGAVCGGTGVCSSLTSWRVQGAGRFCLWALDLVECSALEGLSTRQVVTITWDPQHHAPVSEGVAPGGRHAQVTDLEQKEKMLVWVSKGVSALVRCGPASPFHYLALRWFRSRVGRSGMGPQLGRTAVICGCVLGCGSLASLYRRSCRWESAAGMLEEWTVCPPLSCLWQWLAVCAEVLLPHCVDSTGSAGVVFRLTRVVVEIRGWRHDLRGPWRGSGRSAMFGKMTGFITIKANESISYLVLTLACMHLLKSPFHVRRLTMRRRRYLLVALGI
ncbi:hypothetical protein Taro_053281, partial [Colocasia esculenta]|nr:hypothetical protein [Colocasia esculenta]